MKYSTKRPRPAKFWPVMGFATLAGMRSMSAPAFLSHYLSRQPHAGLDGSPLRFMQKPLTAKVLKAMAAGEMVADKLPGMPDRIAPPVLLGRLLSGALVGAAWYKARHGSALSGGLLGGLGAVASTFISYALRVGISKQADVPVGLVGVGEDALVVAGGSALLSGQQPPHGEWRPM
ncbi:DUF4126 family protein [Hymenobacter sp. BT770]|uniref:DUF4126 family protein n=1 Tax=Hymenobacter sp. BT770 TaxID=2886942 RepID=UPI001D113110|nr:DUF4126 family protein [Hymenobacter sp. BT770]MCC3154914.1 DUF4126 family protein [Hymenobacter sp. BT770]MDO3417336.1 DUF4126 family protein [Hymenobacter sp. BT770]